MTVNTGFCESILDGNGDPVVCDKCGCDLEHNEMDSPTPCEACNQVYCFDCGSCCDPYGYDEYYV